LYLTNNDCNFSVHKLLGIPRSTMWAHIDELEKETGLILINRQKQHTTFTDAGLAFIPFAQKMYEAYEEGLYAARHPSHEEVHGEIFVSTTEAVASTWMTPSIKRFHRQHPQLRVHILAEDKIDRRTEMTADIILRPIEQKGFFTRKWYIKYTHALFASREYLDKIGMPLHPDDLLEHCIIGYGDHEFSYFEDINWHLKGQGYGLPRLAPSLTINSTSGIVTAVKEGIGVASIPVESRQIFDIEIVQVLPEVQGPILRSYFCQRNGVSKNTQRNIAIFEDFFLENLRNMGIQIYHATA
jgi:DNA-binding transcriptional LysR family regulator